MPEESEGGCAFCKIARHEAESRIVFEDDVSLAFLDRRPLFPGHILLVTKTHYETIADLASDSIAPFFVNVQLLSRAVVDAVAADGSFIAINNRVSQSVPHLHVHIVPRRRGDGLKGFFWPRHPYGSEESAAAMQNSIRSAVALLRTGK